MYQRVVIVGNLGRDPELRYMKDGTPVCNFSVATNRRWRDSQGATQEEVCWFTVSVFRTQAEACNSYLSKGRQVLVEGRLKPDKASGGPRVWTSQSGQTGASYELTADTVRFLGGEVGSAVSSGGETGDGQKEEDEIPF